MSTDDALAPVHRLRPRRRRVLAQWPLGVVLLSMAGALIVVATDHFRIGALMLAGSVLLAFVLRLFLPPRKAGMLAVRSRGVDLLVLGALALVLSVFAIWVPPPQ